MSCELASATERTRCRTASSNQAEVCLKLLSPTCGSTEVNQDNRRRGTVCCAQRPADLARGGVPRNAHVVAGTSRPCGLHPTRHPLRDLLPRRIRVDWNAAATLILYRELGLNWRESTASLVLRTFTDHPFLARLPQSLSVEFPEFGCLIEEETVRILETPEGDELRRRERYQDLRYRSDAELQVTRETLEASHSHWDWDGQHEQEFAPYFRDPDDPDADEFADWSPTFSETYGTHAKTPSDDFDHDAPDVEALYEALEKAHEDMRERHDAGSAERRAIRREVKVAAAVEEAVKENLYMSVRSDRGFNHHWPSDLGCWALLPFIAKLSGLTRLAIANVDNSFEEVLSRRGWDVHDELPPADEDPNWRQGLDTVLSGIKEFTAWSVQYRDQLAERMPRLEVAVLEGHQGVVGPATQSTRSIRHLRTGYSPSPPPRHYDDRTPSTAPFFAVLMANRQTLESLHIGRQLDHQPLATSLAHITAPSLRQLKVSMEIGGPLLGTLAE